MCSHWNTGKPGLFQQVCPFAGWRNFRYSVLSAFLTLSHTPHYITSSLSLTYFTVSCLLPPPEHAASQNSSKLELNTQWEPPCTKNIVMILPDHNSFLALLFIKFLNLTTKDKMKHACLIMLHQQPINCYNKRVWKFHTQTSDLPCAAAWCRHRNGFLLVLLNCRCLHWKGLS